MHSGAPTRVTSIVPDLPIIRSRAEGEQRATFFELFFDLVYVFAVTQVSHHLLANLTWSGAAETAFMLVAVYWAWNYTTWMTNWFDPDAVPVRLVLVFVMLASLLMAIAIPAGFGDHALLFACAYSGLQIGRNAFVVWSRRAESSTRTFARSWRGVSSRRRSGSRVASPIPSRRAGSCGWVPSASIWWRRCWPTGCRGPDARQ